LKFKFDLSFSKIWTSFVGVPVTKPEEVKGLLALGGPEESSGYKGYGLSMMVEILCGILSGIFQHRTFMSLKHVFRQSFWSMDPFMENWHNRSQSWSMFYSY